MEFVLGKTVQVSLIGFALAAGFSSFKAVDDYVRTGALPSRDGGAGVAVATTLHAPPTDVNAPVVRPPLRALLTATARLSLEEGLRTMKVVAAATAAAGLVGALRFSPHDERMFALQRDPLSFGAGAGAAAFAFLDDLPLRGRAGTAAGVGLLTAGAVAAAVNSAYFGRKEGGDR